MSVSSETVLQINSSHCCGTVWIPRAASDEDDLEPGPQSWNENRGVIELRKQRAMVCGHGSLPSDAVTIKERLTVL